MKVIVAVKQVPMRDAAIHIDGGGKWIDERDLPFEINEPDAYALEEALELKEKHGGEVIVLSAGPERVAETIREALAKGADRAIHIPSNDLRSLDTLGLARMLASAAASEKPDLILTGLQSDDLGLGQTGVVMAGLLGIPHATIVMEVEQRDGTVRVKRELEDGWFQWVELPSPALLTIQSKLNADYSHSGEGPCFASVQAGAFSADALPEDSCAIEIFEPQLDAAGIRSKAEAPFRDAAHTVDLGSAEVIISVGRGIKEKDNLPLVEEFARALGAELAASRPICDNGWLPMERQVGSSGQTVSPKLYIAVGISGAIQHLVGMKGSKAVIAINKDENAPIFEVADYGIVGDLFEVVPALTAAVRKAKGA